MSKNQIKHSGGCQCGAVRYELSGPLRGVVNCHCAMCRRLHGAFGAYTKVRNSNLSITETGGLTWYQSSDQARRGFCSHCGASLFWQPTGHETTSVAAGSLDQPSGLKTIGHIYAAEKADFYDTGDGLPSFEGSAGGAMDSA